MPDDSPTAVIRSNDPAWDPPAVLELEFLGYEPADGSSDDDTNSLAVRVKWSGPSMTIDRRAPFVTTYELDDLARSIGALLDGRMKVASSRFFDPTLELSITADVPGSYRLTLEFYGESAGSGEHFNVEIGVHHEDLEPFHAALMRQTRRFPARPTSPT